MITPTPAPTASNGRDGNGRFAPGNRFANGNPHAKRIGQLRSALIEMATAGDIQAIREVLLRVLGRPQEADLIERLEKIEETVEAGQ